MLFPDRISMPVPTFVMPRALVPFTMFPRKVRLFASPKVRTVATAPLLVTVPKPGPTPLSLSDRIVLTKPFTSSVPPPFTRKAEVLLSPVTEPARRMPPLIVVAPL